MINHPQLLNATNAGGLMVRVETTLQVAQVQKVSAPAAAATPSASGRAASPQNSAAAAAQGGAAAAAQGSAQPAAAATASAGGADVTVSVARPASANQTGLVQVAVSPEAASAGRGFAFQLSDHLPPEVPKDAPVRVSQVDGKPLPNWLRFDASTQ